MLPPKRACKIFRCVAKDVSSNTLARCYNVSVFQLKKNKCSWKSDDFTDGWRQLRKDSQVLSAFGDEFTKHLNAMCKIGFSHSASCGNIHLEKIKKEKFKSLEDRCIDLKKLFDAYIFEPKSFTLTDVVFDFMLNKDSQFTLLQIKDYKCAPIKRNAQSNDLNPLISHKEVDCTCEGVICKFVSQRQVDWLVQILIDMKILNKKWCKVGNSLIKRKLIGQYSADYNEF